MSPDKSPPERPKPAMRERILDAAEQLLGQGSAAFSMRDLANEAQVSFATPFNHFGNKAAIMLALSARRIAAMHDEFARAPPPGTTPARVVAAVDIAAAVMLRAPDVNRAVMAAIGAPNDVPSRVFATSHTFWTEALGRGAGLAAATRSTALAVLPAQLAFAFRGVLSFWTAGEISNENLDRRARAAAAGALLGFVNRDGRTELLALLDVND